MKWEGALDWCCCLHSPVTVRDQGFFSDTYVQYKVQQGGEPKSNAGTPQKTKILTCFKKPWKKAKPRGKQQSRCFLDSRRDIRKKGCSQH